MIGKAISDLMIKPPKSPVFETPDQYGLDYEDVSFEAADGVSLSGWIVKGGTDKVIIQSHFRGTVFALWLHPGREGDDEECPLDK